MRTATDAVWLRLRENCQNPTPNRERQRQKGGRERESVCVCRHMPEDTRPCSVCGGGDDEGTLLLCEECNMPFHNGLYCAGFIARCDYGDWVCLDCSEHQGNEHQGNEGGVSQGEVVAAGA